VLDTLAEKGDWGKPMPAGKGRGLAIHESYDSIVGMIAEVAVSPKSELKVERVVIAADCGHTVNPRTVAMQLEGGMIYGLSAVLFSEITIRNGSVEQGNFDTYPVVRLKDAPKTEVHLALTGGAKWGGVGEPGAAIIPAAVTNAIFAAIGKRIRSLPIKNQNLSGAAKRSEAIPGSWLADLQSQRRHASAAKQSRSSAMDCFVGFAFSR
jgi:isoquinoline 1-oxidoreductase beta subunit